MARWQERALCVDWSGQLLESLYASSYDERTSARSACRPCPVAGECLRWALERRELWGVWGGRDQNDVRRALGVDWDGSRVRRAGGIKCPRCAAGAERLYVISVYRLENHRERLGVTCVKCKFEWWSTTSAVLVRAYWRSVRAGEREARVRARVRGREMVRAPVVPTPGVTAPLVALAASASRPAERAP